MKSREKDSIQDLDHEQAIAKIKALIDHNRICFFTTNLTMLPLQARPMSVQEVDDEGNIWFLSSRSSNKNIEIEEDNRVQLFFGSKLDSEYLTIFGSATVYTDRKKIEALWNPIAKAWFEQGKDDPDLSVLKVEPEDAYYWDTKHGRIVSLIKIMASAVAGRTMDDGIEGELKI